MQRFHVLEKDITESFVRSSGPGGQNVNKVATCVVLLHRPSGISVKCQAGRTQAYNRLLARELLLDEIERREENVIREKIQRAEKIKRQKRRRPQSLKERILEHKRRHSETKQRRQSIPPHKMED